MGRTAVQILEDIKKATQEQKLLLEALERSTAIKKLWPEAFDHIGVTSSLVGNFTRPRELELKIKNEKEQKIFLLSECPQVLIKYHIGLLVKSLDGAQMTAFRMAVRRDGLPGMKGTRHDRALCLRLYGVPAERFDW